MPFAVAAHLIPVSFMCSARTVITGNGIRYPVATGVVHSVKTMKPVSGLTGNRASCCLFSIPWLLLHCLMNQDLWPGAIRKQCILSCLSVFPVPWRTSAWIQKYGAEIGMTMVLHTHSRKLDFHPHVHVVVPGGGVDKRRPRWKKKKGKYLFNEFAMAKVFRARFLTALKEAGLSIPKSVPPKWVVDCAHAGKGITALKYLSRYLYRGVISEKNIISNQNGQATLLSILKARSAMHDIVPSRDRIFCPWMQHVLPKGFRRVRDYGFLHGNAKKLLSLAQLILHVRLKEIEQRPGPVFKCPCCKSPMVILGFRHTAWVPG